MALKGFDNLAVTRVANCFEFKGAHYLAKKSKNGCTIFFIQNAYNFWSPKQFLLHFYALSFFSDSKFVNFLLFFLIYFLFLANFTLKLVILHIVLEFTAFLSFIAVNGFKFTVYSNKSKNCKNGSHSHGCNETEIRMLILFCNFPKQYIIPGMFTKCNLNTY